MNVRQASILIILVLLGWGVAQLLQRNVPVGKDISHSQVTKAILDDHKTPRFEVASPTLTLVVFTDYQCPACRFANPDMENAVAKDGHVRISYRDWPVFGPLSERAAKIALASDRQGIYPRLHRELMATPLPLDENRLRLAVERAGGKWSVILTDLEEHENEIQSRLAQTQTDAFALGLSGTPSYLAGSILVEGGLSEADFIRLFAQARATRK